MSAMNRRDFGKTGFAALAALASPRAAAAQTAGRSYRYIHLDVFTEHMTGAGARMLDNWDAAALDGAAIDFVDHTMALTLDVVGRALFGSDQDEVPGG